VNNVSSYTFVQKKKQQKVQQSGDTLTETDRQKYRNDLILIKVLDRRMNKGIDKIVKA